MTLSSKKLGDKMSLNLVPKFIEKTQKEDKEELLKGFT